MRGVELVPGPGQQLGPEQVLARLPEWRPEPLHSMLTGLPEEEQLGLPVTLLHSQAPPGSNSCILRGQEQWSEQTLLPGFVA